MFYDRRDPELDDAALQATAGVKEADEVLLRVPEDLILTEERPEPGIVVRKIELPARIDPRQLKDEEIAELLNACLPENPQVIDAWREGNVFTVIEHVEE
ncbi:hypothetical protein [Enterococcus hulanensis]|uniref:hypothetical protein n=1 Tax=Enterococcus hulanensis TaxID=2559929 RepID=UPI0030F3D62F